MAPTPAHLLFRAERAATGALRVLIDRLAPALRDDLAAVEAMLT